MLFQHNFAPVRVALEHRRNPRQPEMETILPRPAQTLSFDVLSMIFSEACCLNSASPIVISAVCRHWREVALGTPTLWSNISTRMIRSKSFLSMFLARSRSAPLDLHIDGQETWIENGEEYTMILKNTERIRCISIRGAVSLLQSSYPNLERLSINFPKPGYPFPPLVQPKWESLHPSLFPRLKVLKVGDVTHSFVKCILTSKLFPQLQELLIPILYSSTWAILPLNGAHNLVSFTMYIHTEPPQMEYLTLPQLRYLKVIENFYKKSKTDIYIDAVNLESIYRPCMPLRMPNVCLALKHPHSVKYLYTTIISEMDHYPSLEELWLDDLFFKDRRSSFLLELPSGISSCPELKVIKFIAWRSDGSEGRDTILSVLQSTPNAVQLSICEPGTLVLPGSTVPRVIPCYC